MSIKEYEENGKKYWQVYVDVRSRKDRRIRVQKRLVGIESQAEAIAEEKRLGRVLTERLVKLESKGLKWRDIIDRWERYQELFPSKRYAKTTVEDYVSLLRNWTMPWLNLVAADLNRGDARAVIRLAQAEGKSGAFCKHLKNTINLIFKWGIDEKLICGVQTTPVQGLDIEVEREEKFPEILSIDQVRALLQLAKEQQHPWYPIWVMALYTGCRSGELQALRRCDVDLIDRDAAIKAEQLPPEKRHYGLIRIRRNWNSRMKELGPTKAGYWRTVPVSSVMYWFLIKELKVETMASDAPLLPQFTDWKLGIQAVILRGFCEANGLPSIKFHTLRACFATHLISTGAPPTIVMKICGWKDLKTMQRYVRLAGVDECGATELLPKLIPSPSDEDLAEKVVSMFGERGERETEEG